MRQPAWIPRQSQPSLSQPQFLHLEVSSNTLTGLEETLIKPASFRIPCCCPHRGPRQLCLPGHQLWCPVMLKVLRPNEATGFPLVPEHWPYPVGPWQELKWGAKVFQG